MHNHQFHSAVALNTPRKAGCPPYLLPRSLAEETRKREQAVIYQEPARRIDGPAIRRSGAEEIY
jgi:hypothetical protein